MNRQQLAQKFFEDLMDFPSRNITKSLSAEIYPPYRVLRLDGRLPGRPLDYEIALVNIHTKEIVYYLDVAVLASNVGGKPLVHFLPYRSSNAAHSVALENFSASVLFDYLVPSHTVVLTDGNPFAGGHHQWSSRVSLAIFWGRRTYYIQRDGVLQRLNNHDDHQCLEDELWSDEGHHQVPNIALLSGKDLSGKLEICTLAHELERRMSIRPENLVLGTPQGR